MHLTPLRTSCLLAFHWPTQVTWPSSKSVRPEVHPVLSGSREGEGRRGGRRAGVFADQDFTTPTQSTQLPSSLPGELDSTELDSATWRLCATACLTQTPLLFFVSRLHEAGVGGAAVRPGPAASPRGNSTPSKISVLGPLNPGTLKIF